MKQTISPIFTLKHMDSRLLLIGASLVLLAGSSLLATAQADDAVYKWVNEYDEVQYTQMPPPHGITAIRIQSAPSRYTDDGDPATPPPTATAEDAVDDGFSDTDPDTPPDAAQLNTELAKSRKENCNNARNNLTSLNRGNIRFMKPNGEVFRLSEEERQQHIKDANDQIKLLCKS